VIDPADIKKWHDELVAKSAQIPAGRALPWDTEWLATSAKPGKGRKEVPRNVLLSRFPVNEQPGNTP